MDFNLLESLNISKETLQLLKELLIVVGMGLLIGLEREHSEGKEEEEKSKLFAGIRTFPLVSLIGYLTIYLGSEISIWIYPIGLLAVTLFVVMAYYLSRIKTNLGGNIGTTTEFALIATFLLSGLVYVQQYLVATFLTLLVTAFLAFKVNLHKAVEVISKREILSILLFIVLTALILPILPNKDFGPYNAFNLFKFWLIISIFLSLNFIAYFLHKFIKSKYSILTAGVLGGFASSTATSWYFSRLGGKSDQGGMVHVAAIVLASSIMFPRLLVWLLILSPELLSALWQPILLFGLFGFAIGLYYSKKTMQEELVKEPEISNPINLKDAISFAVIYVLILLLVGYLSEKLGEKGVFFAAGISGITDVDAITISMTDYAKQNIAFPVAAASILIAAFSNTLVKYIFCLVFGNNNMRKYASYAFVPLFLSGMAYILYLIW